MVTFNIYKLSQYEIKKKSVQYIQCEAHTRQFF